MKTSVLKIKHEVGIVGSGPVGLLLSGFLRRFGIRHVLIDRRKYPVIHPQAHFLNARSMEIVQSFFPDEFAAIVGLLPDSKYWRDFSYCHTLTGTEIHRVNQFTRIDSSFWSSTPSNVAHLAQNKFETILRSVADRAADNNEATLNYLKGYNVKQCSYSSEHISVRAESIVNDNSFQTIELECKYLIGADGANSMVRNSLGIAMQGEEAMQHLVNVHFSCPGLRELLQPRPAMLYFTFNENLVAVFVAHDALSDEWVCQIPYFPPFQERKDFTEEVVRQLISAAIGTSHDGKALPLKIMSVNSWVMHAQVAARYSNSPSSASRSDKNHSNVFLVGDAAHRFPPSGGFGMNTGIQDAHNLAWKLAMVLKGKADPKLLTETYEAERKPAAQAITALSLYNYGLSTGVASALGVDPALANTTVAAANAATLLPFAVRRAAVLKTLGAGTSTLKWMKDWERNMLGGVRVRAMRNLVDNGKSLPLIFPEADLESAYAQGGVVNKSSTVSRREVSFTGLRLALGARLPHVWVAPTSSAGPADISLAVSSVQFPALIDSLRVAAAAESTLTPSLLLIVDSKFSTQATSALEQLSPSEQSAFRVITISPTPASLSVHKHDDLQRQFQIPHFVIDEQDQSVEIKNDQSLIKRYCSVLVGEALPHWTQASSQKRAFEFQCVTGRWNEMIQSYLREQTRIAGDQSDSVAVVVRPDGHVAHIALIHDNSSDAERVEVINDALLSVVKALHLI